ncbi:MAG TPA: excisionase family DNA-binding protein [Xanthobacteraceae bacterium]
MTVAELAALLRIGRNQCYEAVKRGEIRAIRIGRRILIPRVPIQQLLGEK